MKNTIKLIGIIVLVTVMIFSMAACNRGGASGAGTDTAGDAVVETGVDKLLSDFDSAVDEYLSIAQKILDGDLTAALQLTPTLMKVQDTMSDLLTAQMLGEMTEEHIARMESISQKYEDMIDSFDDE